MAHSSDGKVPTRTKVLTILRNGEREMTVLEVAEQAKIHPNTVRFHLDSLIERGQVEQLPASPDGPGRPAVYVKAVAAMDSGGTRQYRVLAEMLTHGIAASPGAADTALRAGRDWGSRLAQVESSGDDPASRLNRVLDELGFAPEQIAPSQIGLRHCPFLELANSAPDVVCSVHLGMMRGLLDALGSDLGVEELKPFVKPDLCVAHLRARETGILGGAGLALAGAQYSVTGRAVPAHAR